MDHPIPASTLVPTKRQRALLVTRPHTNRTRFSRCQNRAELPCSRLNARAKAPYAMHGRVMLRHALFGSPAAAAVGRLAKSRASAIPGLSRCMGMRAGSAHHRAGPPALRPRDPRTPLPSRATSRSWRSTPPLQEACTTSGRRCCQSLLIGAVGGRPAIYCHR